MIKHTPAARRFYQPSSANPQTPLITTKQKISFSQRFSISLYLRIRLSEVNNVSALRFPYLSEGVSL
jgi:hypothetical protein